MKLLLEHGADVNAANKRKSTPLFWALHDESKVRVLLDHGASVNAKTIDGRTPVYQAASMANAVPVLRLLLDKGADANAKTLTGMTPLMAASRTNIEAARLLIGRKADVNARNAASGTALMAAAQTGQARDRSACYSKKAPTRISGPSATRARWPMRPPPETKRPSRLLLDRGAEVNVQDIRGYPPLLYAAGSDAMPAGIVKMLLAKGADIARKGRRRNRRDARGQARR